MKLAPAPTLVEGVSTLAEAFQEPALLALQQLNRDLQSVTLCGSDGQLWSSRINSYILLRLPPNVMHYNAMALQAGRSWTCLPHLRSILLGCVGTDAGKITDET